MRFSMNIKFFCLVVLLCLANTFHRSEASYGWWGYLPDIKQAVQDVNMVKDNISHDNKTKGQMMRDLR